VVVKQSRVATEENRARHVWIVNTRGLQDASPSLQPLAGDP
jgi:hypothetical protein